MMTFLAIVGGITILALAILGVAWLAAALDLEELRRPIGPESWGDRTVEGAQALETSRGRRYDA